MSDQLFLGPEYQVYSYPVCMDDMTQADKHQLLSSVTRKLLRRARAEMDLRLGQSGTMIKAFLQDELSEAHLGLHPSARAHLERFRTLLNGLYAARFGYYPPPSIDTRTTIFEVDVFRTMRADFEALYEYLVDKKLDVSQTTPFLATGGICTLQNIQSFDSRHKFQPLLHPLPLLPDVSTNHRTRMPWLNKRLKTNHSQRALTHMALLEATNELRTCVLDNELVKTYQLFEKDTVYSPMKADKRENLDPIDARKVRWILVYSMYQALRQVTEPPPQVSDATSVPYNVCISTTNLPPWKEEPPLDSILQSHQTGHVHNFSTSTAGSPEIKPDIDHFAGADFKTMGASGDSTQKDIRSRRNSTIRRSWGLLSRQRPREEMQAVQTARRRSPYHEIVVHGYGNGTNIVHEVPEEPALVVEGLSSTSCRSSGTSNYSHSDDDDSTGTPNSSINDSPVSARFKISESQRESSLPKPSLGKDVECNVCRRRIVSSYDDPIRPVPPNITIPEHRSRSPTASCAPAPAPLSIHKSRDSKLTETEKPPPWTSPSASDYIKDITELRATLIFADGYKPEWEQYTDLGGLAEPVAGNTGGSHGAR